MNYTIQVNPDPQGITYLQQNKLNLYFFFEIGAKPREFGNITVLTLFDTNDLGFPPYTIYIKPDTIGGRINNYKPDEKTIIKPPSCPNNLSSGNLYIFEEENQLHPIPKQQQNLTNSFILQNTNNTPLWYALMKQIALPTDPNTYTPKIYSVFTIPPNSTLEIQPKLLAILHYSSDQLKEGQIMTREYFATGNPPVQINLTQQCNSPSLTFFTDKNFWTLAENSHSCIIKPITSVMPLSEYAITEIAQEPSDPYQNLIDLSIPVNFQDNQARYICGSDKGNIAMPYQYPVLCINCTQPTCFKLEPSSTEQTYLEANTIIEIKTEAREDLIDVKGTVHDDRCLLGDFSGSLYDTITKGCCYYYSAYNKNTKWSIIPVSESDTFKGFIKKGAGVYLKNLASEQYLIPKALNEKIYLTVSDQLYPWIIATCIT